MLGLSFRVVGEYKVSESNGSADDECAGEDILPVWLSALLERRTSKAHPPRIKSVHATAPRIVKTT